jgi:hypothetical protein
MHAHLTRRGRAGAAALSSAAVIAVGATITACGSGSPGSSTAPAASASSASSANPGSTSALARIHAESLRFTRCVRADGVPNFPDPPANGGYGVKSFAQQSNGRTISVEGVSVDAPAFRSALAACHRYLPQPPAPSAADLAQVRAEAVRYGRCMRKHGIDIPDPKVGPGPGGRGIGRQIDIPPGMTQDSPAFVAADDTCERTSGFGSPPRQ